MAAELDPGDSLDALETARELIDGPDLKYPVETWFSRGPARKKSSVWPMRSGAT